MDASCSEGPVTSRNKLALTVMDLPQTENVHNTALGAHWARVTPSNLIQTTSTRRHACATHGGWALGPRAWAESSSAGRGHFRHSRPCTQRSRCDACAYTGTW